MIKKRERGGGRAIKLHMKVNLAVGLCTFVNGRMGLCWTNVSGGGGRKGTYKVTLDVYF